MSEVLNKLFRILFMKASERVMKHTCQLFYVRDKTVKAIGTGVLIKGADSYFLISAAHVLETQYAGYMRIPNGKYCVPIGGQIEITAIPKNGERDEDMFDLAIMKLEPEVVKDLLVMYTFLDIENIEVSHVPHAKNQYLVSGYPSSPEYTKIVWEGDKIKECKSRPINLRTGISEKELRNAANCQECYHINLKYSKGDISDTKTGENIFGPELKGVSGAGVWHIPIRALLTMQSTPYKLIGIAIRYVPHSDQVIVVTKIDIITEVLRQKFGLNIPKSKTVTISLLNA